MRAGDLRTVVQDDGRSEPRGAGLKKREGEKSAQEAGKPGPGQTRSSRKMHGSTKWPVIQKRHANFPWQKCDQAEALKR